jgi:hypothetical protein
LLLGISLAMILQNKQSDIVQTSFVGTFR